MSAVRLSLLGCFAGASTCACAQIMPRFLPPQVFVQGGHTKFSVSSHPGRFGGGGYQPPTPGVNSDGTRTSTPGAAKATDVRSTEVVEKAKKKDGLFDWLQSNVTSRLSVTGSRQIGYHLHHVSGDYDAFSSLNYYGMGGSNFTDTGNMSVAGKNVLGFLNFDVAFTDNHYDDPDSQHMTLTYDHGPVRVSAGDIRGSLLNTNPYASFSKSLKGAMAQYGSGRFSIAAIRSETKGTSRTVSLPGENSAGPYYLQSGRIIPDSVQVQVDGKTMKLTDDYLVNTEIGTITFVNRIIAPTSTIVVTYESYSLSSSPGTVEGAEVAYDLGKFGRIGLTGLQQTTGLGGSAGPVTQRFYGYGSASAQYWLDYEPIPGTVQIKVDGILQVEGPSDAAGGDYYFDPNSPFVFYFKRAIGTSQLIDVTYRPKSTQSTDGDRKVWGFDYRYPLGAAGKAGYLQYSQASGQLLNETNPMSGIARGFEGQYKIGKLSFHGSAEDVPKTYVSVEAGGFQRNQKSSDLGLDYESGRFTYSAALSNSSVTSTTTSGTTTTDTVTRLTSASAGINYREPGGMTWSLSHTRTRNRVDDETSLDTTSFSGTRRWGHLSSNFGVDYQDGYGRISDGTTSTLGGIALQTFHVGTQYQLDSGFAFSGQASVSSVHTGLKDGTGTDYTLGVAYRPEGRLSASLNYTQSDSGAAAVLSSFSTGTGYNGNGFSSGGSGSGSYSTAGTNLRQVSAISEYQASKRLNLNAHAASSHSEGSLSSNADTMTYGLGADIDFGNFTQLSVSLDQSNTDYLTSVAQNSTSTSLGVYLNGSPAGRWYYRMGFSQFLTGGTGSSLQNSLSFDSMLGYKLAPRQRLAFTYHTGYTTGVYGQSENSFYLDYSYQLFANLSLVGSYKFRDVTNTGSQATTGAYSSNGLDFELRFDFR